MLHRPQAAIWSRTKRGNKVFDRQSTLTDPEYGRVAVAPTPSPENIEAGRCTHFEFRSWHLVDQGKHAAARAEAARARVLPNQVTKKAAPSGAALLSPHTLSPSAEPMPVSEGIPLNWNPYFDGLHNRNPEGSDGGTESPDEHSKDDTFFKAIPPGARWIRQVAGRRASDG